MTKEEHKEHLLDIMDSMPDDACGDWRDSLAYAIDTIDVAIKIRAIVIEWQGDIWTDNSSYECMCKIADIVTESEDKE